MRGDGSWRERSHEEIEQRRFRARPAPPGSRVRVVGRASARRERLRRSRRSGVAVRNPGGASEWAEHATRAPRSPVNRDPSSTIEGGKTALRGRILRSLRRAACDCRVLCL